MAEFSDAVKRTSPLTKVSVCISNYNYGRYVADAIESCLEQTYGDIEVVVVNDGSTDDSAEVIERYRDRITYITQENAGQYSSIRRAFEASHGDLVIFLDADDRLDPTTVSRVVDAYQQSPDIARIQWRLRVIGARGEATLNTFPDIHWAMSDGDLRDHVLHLRNYMWPPTSANAYPKPVIDLIFSAIGEHVPDVDRLLAETTPLLGSVVTLTGIGGSYRWHGDNMSINIKQDPVGYLHNRISEIRGDHDVVLRLCAQVGIVGCPADPAEAMDWAFAAYRLGSLRLDRASHPMASDRVIPLAIRGIRSMLLQPDYRAKAKLKRIIWFAAMVVAPHSIARSLVDRAFLSPPTVPIFVRSATDQDSEALDGKNSSRR